MSGVRIGCGVIVVGRRYSEGCGAVFYRDW